MKNFLFPLFLILWVILNLLTAGFSELYDDEAYYWMYSNFLAWGYFDHPPMVALMTKVGYLLFKNELGVRLLGILAVSGTLIISYRLCRFKDPVLFALLVLSSFGLNLIGFMSLPDNFILVFGALFFLFYKDYLKNDSTKNAVMLGVIIALMMYSKYHGVLILFFTIISNLSLLKRKSFWVMAVVSLLIFAPHILWQYTNHFPSIQYHLVDRNTKSYSINQTLEYIGGQPLYYGPFIGFIMFYASFRYKTEDRFTKALKFNFVGTLIFFLIMSFNGSIEANWTIIISLPLLIMTMEYLGDRPDLMKWTKIISIPGILLILFVRFHLTTNLINIPGDATSQFKGHRSFASRVEKESAGLPIVANSYQDASILSFYTGKMVPSLNLSRRKNQFNIWDLDRSFIHDTVAFLNDHLKYGKEIKNNKGEIKYLTTEQDLPVFNKVFINLNLDNAVQDGQKIEELHVNLHSPLDSIEFTQSKNHPTYLGIYTKDNENTIKRKKILIAPSMINGQSITFSFPSSKSEYQLWCTIETDSLGTWFESKAIVIPSK